MKVSIIQSICTLALAIAVVANHGQFEHNSVVPSHTGAPAHKPTHHWVAREAGEHRFASHKDEAEKKAGRHWGARGVNEHEHKFEHEHKPHQFHSRDAARHEYAHANAPTAKPTHAQNEAHAHEGMKPTATLQYQARDAARHEYTHADAPTAKPTHAPEASHEHESAAHSHTGGKPSGTRQHHAREAAKPTSHASHSDFKDSKHGDEPKPAHHWLRSLFKPKADNKKPEGAFKPEHGRQHVARDAHADHKFKSASKHAPTHTGIPIVGKPGHHFVRSAARPTGRPAGMRWTTGSAISGVRGILTGATGLKHVCDRCVAAMQLGQSLAQQSSAEDFSSAVVGLCQQVRYKSADGCTSAFAPHMVGPYIKTLAGADIKSEGKGFCKAYFNACS